MNVTVYSKKPCNQCNATFRTMDKKGVDYEVTDATNDIEALTFMKELGHMQAPVVVVRKDGEIVDHWSGYNDDKIAELAEAVAA